MQRIILEPKKAIRKTLTGFIKQTWHFLILNFYTKLIIFMECRKFLLQTHDFISNFSGINIVFIRFSGSTSCMLLDGTSTDAEVSGPSLYRV